MKKIALGLLLGLGMLMVGCGESTPPKKPRREAHGGDDPFGHPGHSGQD